MLQWVVNMAVLVAVIQRAAEVAKVVVMGAVKMHAMVVNIPVRVGAKIVVEQHVCIQVSVKHFC